MHLCVKTVVSCIKHSFVIKKVTLFVTYADLVYALANKNCSQKKQYNDTSQAFVKYHTPAESVFDKYAAGKCSTSLHSWYLLIIYLHNSLLIHETL